jgi:hypothetical protein
MEIKLNDVEAFVDADDLADEIIETETFRDAVNGMMPEIPDLDDYVTHSGLDGHIEGEAAALLRSMPDDPERRCPLGQAFTRAVEQVVLNSDSVQALIEVFVADALDARAQTALDVEWAANVVALPIPGVTA